MRISGLESDVCSSDLLLCIIRVSLPAGQRRPQARGFVAPAGIPALVGAASAASSSPRPNPTSMDPRLRGDDDQEAIPRPRYSATSPATSTMAPATRSCRLSIARIRSEEHTSELQSLMRNSYAVFCLKKKNKKNLKYTKNT